VVSTGCRCLHVAMPDLVSVADARPDYHALTDLSRQLNAITVQIMTLETELEEAYSHVRTFAPAVGDRRRFIVEQGANIRGPHV